MEDDRAPPQINGVPLHVVGYMLIFFFAMVGHELALEATNAEFADRLPLSYAVTAFQFGFCILQPLLVSRGRALQKFPSSLKGCIPYVKLSLLVFGATALATESLRYVTYPTKVVFKASKLIPTMFVATILHQGTKYGLMDYTAAALLCLGTAGYSYKSGSTQGGPVQNSVPGLVLLLISIFCDAFVPNLQQSLMTAPPSKSPLPQTDGVTTTTVSREAQTGSLTAEELMINVNTVGLTGLVAYMAISGHLVQVTSSIMTHPRLLMYLLMVGVGLSTAVWAYTRLIQASGSVVAVGVATLRKVATVILSYLFFPKPLLGIHVASGFLVLGGLLLSSMAKQRSSSQRK